MYSMYMMYMAEGFLRTGPVVLDEWARWIR